MFVEELDVSVVDALGDFFADLVRAASFDHVVARPSILGFGTRGSAHEEVVFKLALEVVLFHVLGQGGGDLLGVADAREAGPADVGIVWKMFNEVFGFGQLVEVGWAPDTRPEQGRGGHGGW